MSPADKCALCHDPAWAALEHTRIIYNQFKDRPGFEVLRATMSIRLRRDVASNEANYCH
jgi:hypothetical protein